MHIEDHDPLDRLQEAARQYRNTRTWPRVQADHPGQAGRHRAADRPRPGRQPPRRPGVGGRLQPGRPGGAAGPAPPRPHADPAARPGGPLPGADRRPAAPRGRGLRAAGRRHPPDPGAGVRRPLQPRRGLRAAPPARLQRPDAAAAAPRRQPRGPGVLQGDRRRADRRDRRAAPRRGGPGLAPGRGPVRPAGDAHAGLGPPRLAAPRGCARTGGSRCTC